jgi:hypothetical protein
VRRNPLNWPWQPADKETAVDRNDKKKAPGRMTAETKDQEAGHKAKSPAAGTPQDEGLSPELQAHIGRQVRAMFDEVAQEPVPDHLLQLLKDLDRNGEK